MSIPRLVTEDALSVGAEDEASRRSVGEVEDEDGHG